MRFSRLLAFRISLRAYGTASVELILVGSWRCRSSFLNEPQNSAASREERQGGEEPISLGVASLFWAHCGPMLIISGFSVLTFCDSEPRLERVWPRLSTSLTRVSPGDVVGGDDRLQWSVTAILFIPLGPSGVYYLGPIGFGRRWWDSVLVLLCRVLCCWIEAQLFRKSFRSHSAIGNMTMPTNRGSV